MQRRALMLIELPQVDLFDLSAAGAIDIEKVEPGGDGEPESVAIGVCRIEVPDDYGLKEL